MKILELCSASAIGGGERHLADLSNSLAERGHDVFFGLRPYSQLRELLRSIPIENISTFGMRNSLDIPSAVAIARFAGEIKVDLIHAHLGRDYPLAALASRLSGVPFVITRHVMFPMKAGHKFLLRSVAGVTAPSDAVAATLTASGVFSGKEIVTIHYGIDTDRFAYIQRVPHNNFTVGTIGQIAPVKGHDVFVEAAAKISAKLPEARFVIVGEDQTRDKRYLNELKEKIADPDLTDKVTLSGWKNDVRPLFAEMDVFVSASRSESFGLVIAEAMASGVPVVATMSAGACEVIEDSKSGILVPIDDAQAIADAVVALASDTNLRSRLIENGYRRVVENFSMKRMVDETEAFYQTVIAAKGR
jgi:glycosyltransferase involved in cell wall biosynthesis